MKTKRNYIIKRWYPGDPFNGDQQIVNYMANNVNKSFLEKVSSMSLNAIDNAIVKKVISGGNELGWQQNLMLRSIPIITSYVGFQYNIVGSNALALLQSIIVRYLAYKMTGSTQYGVMDMFRDATHMWRLGKNTYNNTLTVYNKVKSGYSVMVKIGTFIQSFFWRTKTVKETLRLTSAEQGIEHGHNISEMVNQNVNPVSFMDQLAQKYMNMTHIPIKTDVLLQQGSYEKTKNMVDEAIKNQEHINNNIQNVPETVEQVVTEMTLFGKIFFGIVTCIIIFVGYKYIDNNYPEVFKEMLNLKDNLINKIWKKTPVQDIKLSDIKNINIDISNNSDSEITNDVNLVESLDGKLDNKDINDVVSSNVKDSLFEKIIDN